jgi:osmotically-inducible protein OsmY
MSKTEDIRGAVEAELIYDPLLDAADIGVQNIGGEVALNGTVPSYPQYLDAVTATQRVSGVTKVHNHLEVILPLDEVRDDAMLTTAANNALASNVTVPAGVEATAKDGNLTLTGAVRYGSQRLAAASTVAGLIGVRQVKNEIEVASDADPVEVRGLVQNALDRYSLVWDDSDIVVHTQDRTVTLTGHVRTWAEHDAVIHAAWMADGVYEVRDELLITG